MADVGLTGELKKIPNIEVRLKELDRMGYGDVYVSKNTPVGDYKNINVVPCNMIGDVLRQIGFGRKGKED